MDARDRLSEADLIFVRDKARGESGRLTTAALSPYTRKHIRRSGQYDLDMEDRPDPLVPKPWPSKLPL